MAEPSAASTAQKTRVFISYARADVAFADALVSALEQHDIEVLIDRRNLPYGEERKPELLDFLRGADAIVFIVSPRSIRSPWCRWELEQVEAESQRLVPIVLETVPIEDLPPEIADISLLSFVHSWNVALGARDTFLSQATTLAKVLLANAWVKEHTYFDELANRWRAAHGGEADGTDEGLLLRGNALSEAELWISRRPREAPEPSELLWTFIRESRKAEQVRAERERKQLLTREQELNQREQRFSEEQARTEREREQLLTREQELNQREQQISEERARTEREREELLAHEQELNQREQRISEEQARTERERDQLFKHGPELDQREQRISEEQARTEREREQLLKHEQELNQREQRISEEQARTEREREQLLKHEQELNQSEIERARGILPSPASRAELAGTNETSPRDTQTFPPDPSEVVRRLAASAAEVKAILEKMERASTNVSITSSTAPSSDAQAQPPRVPTDTTNRSRRSWLVTVIVTLLLLTVVLAGLTATGQIDLSEIVQQLRRAVSQ